MGVDSQWYLLNPGYLFEKEHSWDKVQFEKYASSLVSLVESAKSDPNAFDDYCREIIQETAALVNKQFTHLQNLRNKLKTTKHLDPASVGASSYEIREYLRTAYYCAFNAVRIALMAKSRFIHTRHSDLAEIADHVFDDVFSSKFSDKRQLKNDLVTLRHGRDAADYFFGPAAELNNHLKRIQSEEIEKTVTTIRDSAIKYARISSWL